MTISVPRFDMWDRETLNNFAKEVYEKLQLQDEEIQHLRLDVKDAIKAYRDLATKVLNA